MDIWKFHTSDVTMYISCIRLFFLVVLAKKAQFCIWHRYTLKYHTTCIWEVYAQVSVYHTIYLLANLIAMILGFSSIFKSNIISALSSKAFAKTNKDCIHDTQVLKQSIQNFTRTKRKWYDNRIPNYPFRAHMHCLMVMLEFRF